MVQRKIHRTLVILTRNEIDGLKKILPKIPLKQVDEVFAVDYKSTDGTIEFFEKNHIKVIKQKTKGRGRAFILASKKAKGDQILLLRPDGNENPTDMPKLFKLLDEGCDIAITSRFMKG